MKYYKTIETGYITIIGTGAGGTEITAAEYNEILAVIRNRPHADGKGYRLKTDLTWEAYGLPPEPEPSDTDEVSDAEALNVITGVTA